MGLHIACFKFKHMFKTLFCLNQMTDCPTPNPLKRQALSSVTTTYRTLVSERVPPAALLATEVLHSV